MKKTVLITGASRGIGAQCAREFAKNGYNVIINYNNSQEKALALVEEIKGLGETAIAVKADVSSFSQTEKMVDEALDKFSHIDVLICNAGISQFGLFTDTDESDFNKIYDINVKGTYNAVRHVLPSMIRRKSGSIINISSMWGEVGASCEVLYSSAKSAIIGMTKALAKEVGPSGIRVNCVSPGVIMTDMSASLSEETLEILKDETPLGTLGTARDIAKTCVFLASENSSFITGQVIGVNGGLVI